MRTREGCIFCSIVAGKAPAHRVAEDPEAIAFLDIFPVAEGHTLVIPKDHAENLYEMQEGPMRATGSLLRRVARALRAELAPEGLAAYQANGAAAGQTVWHYHVHLIPRKMGEPMSFHGRGQGEDKRLLEIAARIGRRIEPA